MDVNDDGKIDILSGCYSRDGREPGLFYVLWGKEGGGFGKPVPLKSTAGEPLSIASGKDENVKRICTRPTAVDLDGDGDLDIVSGNFEGTFAVFLGEGKGRFAPKHTFLEAGGQPMRVDGHSDPFFVDWDKDGDLDLISGTSMGGVVLFENRGSRTQPEFARATGLVKAVGHHSGPARLGEDFLKGPQSDTRVWVDDVNGDGLLDLLVGDMVTLNHPADGVEPADVRTRLAAWTKRQEELMKRYGPGPDGKQPTAEARRKWQADYQALMKEREAFMRSEMTGFVWVLYQKKSAAGGGG